MRENLDHFFMKIAFMYATRSTCLRRQVGCVIVRDKSQVAAGYNGALAGETHCIDNPDQCIRTKMNVPSGERSELCITGDNYIRLAKGGSKTIQQLASKGENIQVCSIDEATGEVISCLALTPRLTGYRSDILKITFDNDKSIKCTSDHNIMTSDCKYVMAKKLKVGDTCKGMKYIRSEVAASDHKVTAIKKIKESCPVYDMTVPESNNFAIDLGNGSCIAVHNCVASHSESSAIAQAAKNGINLNGTTIYVTHKPCVNCIKLIIASGIKRLVYCHDYGSKLDNEITDKLLKNIEVTVLDEKDFIEGVN